MHIQSYQQYIKLLLPKVWDAVAPMLKEPDAEKAKAALRESGLSEENETWVKLSEDEVVVEIESFPWSRDLVETVVTNLQNVNLNAEHIVQEQSVLFGISVMATSASPSRGTVSVDRFRQVYPDG